MNEHKITRLLEDIDQGLLWIAEDIRALEAIAADYHADKNIAITADILADSLSSINMCIEANKQLLHEIRTDLEQYKKETK